MTDNRTPSVVATDYENTGGVIQTHPSETQPLFRMNVMSAKQPLEPQLSLPGLPRPPLRSRSTDGLTVSSAVSYDADATTTLAPTRISHDGRGAGHEFAVAEVPSPVLMNPSQGLNGLSEALAHLVTENAARSINFASPAMSRQESNEADGNGGGIYSPSAVTAAIASAGNKAGFRPSGAKTTGLSTRQASSDMTTNYSSPPTAMTSVSSRSPSDGVHGKSTSAGATPLVRDAKTTAAFVSGKSSRPASGALTPTAFAMLRRASNDMASHGSSPGSSGKSTPLLKFSSSSRSKPKVLETTHLHLQTHGPSGRRMINQYIIEDELGRGVHGKVRLARDTDTGERVAVKIVEREGKKRLGGGPGWAARAAAAASKNTSNSVAMHRHPANEDEPDGESSAMAVDQDKPGDVGNGDAAHAAHQQTRFASPPTSPSSSSGTRAAARQGRWGEGSSSRPTYADREAEKEREKARKRLLWTTDQKVKREIALMKKCAHENVVRLREVIDDPQSKKIFMVLEYMEGGEVRWKDDRGFPTLTVDQARRTLRDVVLGLEYLHYQGIIHRDIKPANLLWDKQHRLVKISDFGVSHFSYALLVASGGLPSLDSDEERQRDPSLADDRELAKTAGSPAFFAPELCMAGEPAYTTQSIASGNSLSKRDVEFPWKDNGAISNDASVKRARPQITKAIDVWALGVTLYCLLFGHVPFTADSEYALFSVIMKEDFGLPLYMGADRIRIGPRKKRWMHQQPWTDEEGDVDEDSAEPDIDPARLGEEALMVRDLLDRLLEKDPSKRISLEEVKKHPWLTRDIADPPLWLSETDPAQLPFVEVTHEDVETALTGFSKFKQTMKRFQHKFFSTLSGAHTPVTEHSPPPRDTSRSQAKAGMAAGPHRRRRSKSASQASREVIMTSIEAKAPGSTAAAAQHPVNAKGSLATKSKAPSPPVAHSGRPNLFFSRRRSTALDGDGGKNPLSVAGLAAGTSISQPNSRPHSPMGSKERLTEQKPVLLLPQQANAASHETPPINSLTPIVSGEVTTEHANSLSASMAHLGDRPSKSGQNRMRPSSRGSLRTLEAFHFLHDPRRGTESGAVDGASTGFRARSAQVSPSASVRDGTLAAQDQPARTRSRPRLGDVFRNVWHGGSHNGNSEDGSSARSFRFRSRPATAASSNSVSPSLEKSVAALQQKRNLSDGVVPISAAAAAAPAAPVSAVRADSPPTEMPTQPQEGQDGDENGSARAIDVDDYDVDLDLSDDDSDVEQRRSSMQPHRVLRGTSAGGWAVESMSRQQSSIGGGAGTRDSGGYTTGEDSHQSATPSVEGGYNLYKPPFTGRFQFTDPFAPPGAAGPNVVAAAAADDAGAPHGITMDLVDSSETAALRRGSEVDEMGGGGGSSSSSSGGNDVKNVHQIRLPLHTSAHTVRPAAPTDGNPTLDTSFERFADADELSEGEEEQQRHEAEHNDYDDDEDDDDECVSFQAGRRQQAH